MMGEKRGITLDAILAVIFALQEKKSLYIDDITDLTGLDAATADTLARILSYISKHNIWYDYKEGILYGEWSPRK